MIENESWQLYGSIPWSRPLDFSQGILFLKIKNYLIQIRLRVYVIRPIKLNQETKRVIKVDSSCFYDGIKRGIDWFK